MKTKEEIRKAVSPSYLPAVRRNSLHVYPMLNMEEIKKELINAIYNDGKGRDYFTSTGKYLWEPLPNTFKQTKVNGNIVFTMSSTSQTGEIMKKIIAFSKRFTSPVMGWMFPVKVEVERSYAGHVGGVQAWTRLDMTQKQAEAMLKYASKAVHYCSISLLNGEESVGRTAWDMSAAKGFSTPKPSLSNGASDIPGITEDDVFAWLSRHKDFLSREQVDLSREMGFSQERVKNLNGHEIVIVSFLNNSYVLPHSDDKNTEKAIQYLWRRYGGKAAKAAAHIWAKSEMELPLPTSLSEKVKCISGRDDQKYFRIIPNKFPAVVLEVFNPLGRYLWFETDQMFSVNSSGSYTHDVYIYNDKTMSNGCYSNKLPGEDCPEGWEFALQLYKRLHEEGLDFKVSRPLRWSSGYTTVDLKINRNDKLNDKIQRKMGWVRNEIPQRMWNEDTIQKIMSEVQGELC